MMELMMTGLMVLFKSPEESEKLAEKGIQSLGTNIDQDAIEDL